MQKVNFGKKGRKNPPLLLVFTKMQRAKVICASEVAR